MKRPLRPDEARLWAQVAATVEAAPGRQAPMPSTPSSSTVAAPLPPRETRPRATPKPQVHHRHGVPDPIEPRRLRRLSREREDLGPRIDLHGMSQDQAREALARFLTRASEEGWRAVLVITGKGPFGDGLLRRRTPDWLSDPAVRFMIAGVSEAHRRHGGKGALYVALRRRMD
jgi:DNA-nicking Smr family endonuclease